MRFENRDRMPQAPQYEQREKFKCWQHRFHCLWQPCGVGGATELSVKTHQPMRREEKVVNGAVRTLVHFYSTAHRNLLLLCKHTYTHTATAERLTNQSRMCESRCGVTVPGGEICELTPSSVYKHHLERMDSNEFTVCSVSFTVKVFSKRRLKPNSQSHSVKLFIRR